MSRHRTQSYRHLLSLYATLSQVNQSILRTNDADTLFRKICRISTEYGHFRFAWIGIHDTFQQEIRPVAWSGEGAKYLQEIRIFLDPERPESLGPAATALRTGKPQVIHDFFRDSRTIPWVGSARRYGFRSSIGVAISRGGKNIGVLNLYAGEKSYFGRPEQQLVREMALDISFALDYFDSKDARLTADRQLQSHRERLSFLLEETLKNNRQHDPRQILRAFSRSAHTLTGSTRIAFGIFEHGSLAREDFSSTGDSLPELPPPERERIASWARTHRQAYRSDRLSDDHPPSPPVNGTWVHIPVFGAKDNYLGFLEMICPEAYIKSDPDIAFLSALTAQIAGSLENAFLLQALSISESRLRIFQKTFESATVPLCICDALRQDLPIIFANEHFSRVTGYPLEETVGKNCRFLQGTDRDQEEREYIRTALAAGKPIRTILRNYRKDGSLFINELSIFPITDPDGTITHFLGIQNDITDTLSLRKNREIASQVFDMASDGILLTDSENRIILVNRAFTEITGYSLEDVQGKNPSVLASGRHDSFFYQAMWNELLTVGYWQGELWNRKKSGEVYPEWLSISTRKNGDGTVENYIGIFHDLTGVKESEERIAFLAYHDPLTGLPNRVLLRDRLEYAILQSTRRNRKLGLLLIDLDGFKNVNDLLGHHTGDQLLVEVSRRMTQGIRTSDSVGRMGGDEFLVIFPDLHDLNELSSIILRLMEQIHRPYEIDGQSIILTTSGGVTLYPEDHSGLDDLVRHADIAMYSAKNRGKNRVHYYELSMETELRKRENFKQEMIRALKENDLRLVYQPQVDILNGEIIGVEALLRWYHQDGIRYPGDFLGFVENDDLSVALGRWVLKSALEQHDRWKSNGMDIRISVNIFPRHFNGGTLVGDLASLGNSGFDLSGIALEITENTLVSDLADIQKTVQSCKEQGIQISLDDFGTGYTSLTMVRILRPDSLKVDQSFIRESSDNEGNRSILESILKIGEGFHACVIQEGVEKASELRMIREMGYRHIQGFLVSRPLLPEDLELFFGVWRKNRLWKKLGESG
uniref:EAL domain-containing protein n=1 Tax=Leptospirillum ferriphilum TaxID=178606 RepID=A0A7C3R3T4_9BACT